MHVGLNNKLYAYYDQTFHLILLRPSLMDTIIAKFVVG